VTGSPAALKRPAEDVDRLSVVRRRPLRIAAAATLGALAFAVAGCGGATSEAGSVPESASLAPKDALGFVTIVTDEGSDQWRRADRLLALFPDARESVVSEIEQGLTDEGLSWDEDVAPALGSETVVVVTKDTKVVVFTKPDDPAALEKLVASSDTPLVTDTVSGWTAMTETRADLDGYRASVAQGTLETVETFRSSMAALPAGALARGWADLRNVTEQVTQALDAIEQAKEIEVEDLAAAVSAEDDGVFLSVGVRGPDAMGSTSYEPTLLTQVPANAVLALSFGGTQGTLDKVERSVDLEGISGFLDDMIGVSFDGVLEALSGEGVLYVREGTDDFPEITLVLDPDADETWASIEKAARKIATDAGGRVETGTQGGRTVNRLVLEELTVVYTRVDSDVILVSTGTEALDQYLGDGAKLEDESTFRNAADRVDLGDRTNGFVYVDIDGLIPFVESLAGPDTVPADGREVLSSLDSVILQTDAGSGTVRFSGFLRVSG
jgi:hypothetical protein